MDPAEVLDIFNSIIKKMLKKLSINSMDLCKEETKLKLKFIPRKMTEKTPERNNTPICSLIIFPMDTITSSLEPFSKLMELLLLVKSIQRITILVSLVFHLMLKLQQLLKDFI